MCASERRSEELERVAQLIILRSRRPTIGLERGVLDMVAGGPIDEAQQDRRVHIRVVRTPLSRVYVHDGWSTSHDSEGGRRAFSAARRSANCCAGQSIGRSRMVSARLQGQAYEPMLRGIQAAGGDFDSTRCMRMRMSPSEELDHGDAVGAL